MSSLQRITIAPFGVLFQPLYCVSSLLYGYSFVLQSKHFVRSLVSDTTHYSLTHSLTVNCTPYIPSTLSPESKDAVNANAYFYGVVSSKVSVRMSVSICET